MLVSRICMTVISITDTVIIHLPEGESVVDGCAISVTPGS
jgi:hypothetical protein